MQLSAKKQKDLTYLEVQAQQIVNENESDPEVNDEERYENLLSKKADRRAVSLEYVQLDSQGESLYDFLERQVKGQMREALGQPLQNISQELLNKVVSRDVQAGMRKFKMSLGKTPNKENRNTKGTLSAEKGSYPSPTRKLQFAAGSPDRAARVDMHDTEHKVGNSRVIKELIKELDSGIHDKVSLIKMLILKCGEADSSYKKIRQLHMKGDALGAEKIISMLEQLNGNTLKDLQNEISHKADLLDTVSQLGEQIQKEKKEIGRSKSSNGDGNHEMKKRIDELQHKIRHLEQMKPKDGQNDDLMNQLNEADDQVHEYKRRLEVMERENSKLREEMRQNIDDFQRQLDIRDNEIRGLNKRMDGESTLQASEIQMMLKKENESYKQDNRLLRDKIGALTHEIDNMSKKKSSGNKSQLLESEISHLRQQLADKERDSVKQVDHFKNLIHDKEQLTAKQKNEWAEIYGNMKQEIEDLKNDNRVLNQESEKLLKQLEMGGGGNRGMEKELAKKLKKRELECSALWETLRDMHISARNIFDARQMMDLLALRALDTKAKRKLKI